MKNEIIFLIILILLDQKFTFLGKNNIKKLIFEK